MHSHAQAHASQAALPHSVDELLALAPAELEALYRGASVPKLADLDGDLRGRMLAWPAVGGAPAKLMRALAGTELFPWRGKSFQASGAAAGEGANRVILDRWRLFRFTTSIGPSRAGAFDAVQLDYDHPGNPFFIRAIKDEVRELRPGLFLGQAWLGARLVLYFGLGR